MWSYEAIESDDETDQSGGMEEDSEHPRLSPASEFFTKKKGLATDFRVICWYFRVEEESRAGTGTGRIVAVKVDMLIWEEVWKVQK